MDSGGVLIDADIEDTFSVRMGWITCNQMDSKLAFISDYELGGLSFTELCRRHQISRSNGYKWLARYKAGGTEGLNERSRRPRHSPQRSHRKTEQLVIDIRKAHPVWGGRKIRKVLENEGMQGDLPPPSMINGILRRHNLLGSGTREGSTQYQRF